MEYKTNSKIFRELPRNSREWHAGAAIYLQTLRWQITEIEMNFRGNVTTDRPPKMINDLRLLLRMAPRILDGILRDLGS